MKIRIGSRASKLAVIQTEWVMAELKKKNPTLEITAVQISSAGDKDTVTEIQKFGGKGVFVKELEEALLSKDIDLAVHSLKDVPQSLPHGLCLGAYPLREDPRDAVISRFGEQIHELPKNSIVGTGSPRRKAQIHFKYKKRSYRIEPIRGNVDTRLKKLQSGQYDAVVLALAGLKRLGLESEITQILEPQDMLPAPCQGCLGLEVREDNKDILSLLEEIRHPASDTTARAERAFLQGLGGDCSIPLGAYSRIDKDKIFMEAVLFDESAQTRVTAVEEGPSNLPELVGAQLAGRLLFNGGSSILLTGSLPQK
jgi:hydroxymethylbilane synthase